MQNKSFRFHHNDQGSLLTKYSRLGLGFIAFRASGLRFKVQVLTFGMLTTAPHFPTPNGGFPSFGVLSEAPCGKDNFEASGDAVLELSFENLLNWRQ